MQCRDFRQRIHVFIITRFLGTPDPKDDYRFLLKTDLNRFSEPEPVFRVWIGSLDRKGFLESESVPRIGSRIRFPELALSLGAGSQYIDFGFKTCRFLEPKQIAIRHLFMHIKPISDRIEFLLRIIFSTRRFPNRNGHT